MENKRKLTYDRPSIGRSLLPKRNTHIEHSENKQNVQLRSVPTLKGYEKTDGVLSYNIICVISGGERKEKMFLDELIRHKNLHSLRIAFISKDGQGLQPNQMLEKWEGIQSAGEFNIGEKIYYLDSTDKVFLLSDVDEFYDQLVKIFSNHKNHQGQWIISNPCFEIWLYYCFKNDPNTDLACLNPLTVDKRSKKMKHIGNTVVRGGLNPLLAFEKMKDGIKHSLNHYAEDQNSIPVLYATQMHKMAQYLVDTMNNNANEYTEFVKRKAEWRKLMKQKAIS